jgi:ribosomal protein L37AE/L43A
VQPFEPEAQYVAQKLDVGNVQRTECPACGQRDFVVGRESDRVWWKCFRATCGIRGVTGSANLPTKLATERQRDVDRLRPYMEPTYLLSPDDQKYFRTRFELFTALDHIRVTDFDEYILPVRGPDYLLRGHVVRQPIWRGDVKAPRKGRDWDPDASKAMPKTKLYSQSVGSLLAWYHPSKNDLIAQELRGHIVLVEDQISAIKCAEAHVTAVALLGNALTVAGVRDLCRLQPHCVTVALDPGAERAAHHLASSWGLYFKRTRVVALEADPKDVPIGELLSELGL